MTSTGPVASQLQQWQRRSESLGCSGTAGALTYWFLIMSTLLLFIYLPAGGNWDDVLTTICEAEAPSKSQDVNFGAHVYRTNKGPISHMGIFLTLVGIGSQLIPPRSLQTVSPFTSPLPHSCHLTYTFVWFSVVRCETPAVINAQWASLHNSSSHCLYSYSAVVKVGSINQVVIGEMKHAAYQYSYSQYMLAHGCSPSSNALRPLVCDST